MLQSFFNSISGVKSHQFGMDVTSNNIANVNTYGFKGSDAEFKNIFAKAAADRQSSTTTDQIGLGSTAQTTALDTKQGTFENTDRAFDLAIGGDGWFNVAPGQGENEQQSFYTRDGNFSVNADGFLVNSSGYFVQGITADNITPDDVINPNVEIDPQSEQTGPIRIPTQLTYPPTPTDEVTLRKNLAHGTTQQSQSIGIVTPQGERTNLDLEFSYDETDQPANGTRWNYSASVEGSDDDPTTGALDFDTAGGLIGDTVLDINNFGQNMTVDLGGGFDGVISTTGEVSTAVTANGRPEGNLDNYRVDQDGNVVASFDNSNSAYIGKIPLYHFQNDQGLDKEGENLFQASANSGDPTRFETESGKSAFGSKILSHKLENSNVQLSQSLTNLIVYQKAFDANSKGITTSDQMIQTAINMKR